MRQLATAVVFLGLAALGCSGPNAQLTACQQDKDQLLTTIREQRDANRVMREQVASLESRLGESEKELARLGRPGTRLSSRPVENAELPWRGGSQNLEASNRKSEVADVRPPTSDLRTPSSGTLAALAARDQRLKFDAKSGVASLNVDVPFEGETANLTAEAKRRLDDVAKLLKAKEAKDLRVLVSGYAEGRPPKSGENAFSSARKLGAARAQAVADYLDRHGIAEERLGVSGVGSRLAATQGATSRGSSGVQILLAEPETPLVGWGGTDLPLRR
jgi:outer membrane protein OmpA-like peptidoglycan-associated protein